MKQIKAITLFMLLALLFPATASANDNGFAIESEPNVNQVAPIESEPIYGVGLKKIWSVNNTDALPAEIPVNDMRQGFGMNGKFYVNSKSHIFDYETQTYISVPIVYVFDETGRLAKTYPGGLNCGITRDEAGNLVISDAQFPGNWDETATIKVINPETNVTKVYTVPAECGINGRCDFLGFAKGDLMGEGVLYLVDQNTTGVSVMTISRGEVNTDECYPAPCNVLSPTNSTVVNYYKDLAGEDAMLYVTRYAAPVKLTFDGSNLVGTTITLPNKGACNGAFPFIWNDKELFVYPTLPNYLDGFAIAEANADKPLYVQGPTKASNPNGIQCNWLNAEVDEDGVIIYQYVPGAGGYFAVYRIGEFEQTQMPEITYEITEDAVIITATGSANVKMYVNGVLVGNPYTIARRWEDFTIIVTATAQEDGKIISETAEQEILIPRYPNKTDMPVITFNTTDEAVELTAYGKGEVLLYINGELVTNPYTIARGEEDFTITVTATAQEEGKRVSDEVSLTLEVPALRPKTDMPVITFNTTNEAVIITATGSTNVKMYVDGVLVENPYTIARGEEDFTIIVSATAQEEGKRVSDEATLSLVIPALAAKSSLFIVSDTTVMHGDTVVIPVAMVNEESIISFQTDIFLPEGLEIVKEDGEYVIDASGRMTRTHSILSDDVSNGAVRVLCYSSNYKPFTGESGDDLFYITVRAADDAAGDYTISLRNTLLTTSDFDEIAAPEASANIHVLAYLLGDANNSGTVTVTDVVVTSQYVLERDPEPFNFAAADVNADGNITVTDVSRIAWMVLNENAANPVMRASALCGIGDRMSSEGVTLKPGETRTVNIQLDNMLDYSAFQLDLTLPDGLAASNFALTGRADSHILDMNTRANGKMRVLCYSPAVAAINDHYGAVLTFDVTARSRIAGDITVDGIELVTTACQTVVPNAFTIGVNTVTAVNELTIDKAIARMDYYNIAGQRIDRPMGGVTLVVTTYTDGTRTTTKLIK